MEILKCVSDYSYAEEKLAKLSRNLISNFRCYSGTNFICITANLQGDKNTFDSQ